MRLMRLRLRVRVSLLVTAVLAVMMSALPVLANGERDAPKPPDTPETTTTTTAPTTTTTVEEEPTTTTTVATPPPPVADPPSGPTTTTTTTTAPTTTLPATPEPYASVQLECPGWFVFTIGNTGSATAEFQIQVVIEETARIQEAELRVEGGEEIIFDDFYALAGEEDSSATISIVETGTGWTSGGLIEEIDCRENPDPIILGSTFREDACPPNWAPRTVSGEGEQVSSARLTGIVEDNPWLLAAGLLLMILGVAFALRRAEERRNAKHLAE